MAFVGLSSVVPIFPLDFDVAVNFDDSLGPELVALGVELVALGPELAALGPELAALGV